MTNQNSKPNDQSRNFDLYERTAMFGEAIIDLAKKAPINEITRSIINQLVRAGTSVGANYGEADNAVSKKDFRHKIGLCKKEARETMHWLRMLSKVVPELAPEARKLWKEAHELVLIFGAIGRK